MTTQGVKHYLEWRATHQERKWPTSNSGSHERKDQFMGEMLSIPACETPDVCSQKSDPITNVEDEEFTLVHKRKTGRNTPKVKQAEAIQTSNRPKVESRKRQLKAQGTMKMGFHCTAAIFVKDFDSHVEVSYYKGHYKHEKSLCHVPLPEVEKELIAEKMTKIDTCTHIGEKPNFEHLGVSALEGTPILHPEIDTEMTISSTSEDMLEYDMSKELEETSEDVCTPPPPSIKGKKKT
ncbi:hypothetical protein HNY73_021319 [Argiope bruennichi]|uniref:Uncharacterized protein n=1 Tax=Argiope bruennichi TaxID=94029 RepID=A0A8T0E1D1_ARGBR|nr:hypothetical protein HNY73_021319 [Argiope bruennichi]